MNTYIAMLRGINVSGQKKILMVDLRAYMEEIGFEDVETYIQSGNIAFKSSLTDESEVETLIKAMISKQYGWDVPTLVKRAEDIRHVLDNCPYLEPGRDITRLYVTFLDQIPDAERVSELEKISYPPEEFILDGKNIYFYSPLGAGKAKMSNNFFENKLKVSATSRNWKTVNKLLEMALS